MNASNPFYSKIRRRNELSKWQTFSVRAVGHKYHGVVLLNVESTFEVRNCQLELKIEQLTKQKLFSSRKQSFEEKSTSAVNENAPLKNEMYFIVAPFKYLKQRFLIATCDPKRRPTLS